MRRGDSHIQEKCTSSTATLSACRRRDRHAMRHAADGKRLNQRLTVCVVPYTARVPPDRFLIRGTVRKPVHVGPLPNDVFTVERFYDRIAGAMPYRDFRPWPPMSGCCPHGDAGYQGRQFHNALKKILPHLRTQIVSSLIPLRDRLVDPDVSASSPSHRR